MLHGSLYLTIAQHSAICGECLCELTIDLMHRINLMKLHVTGRGDFISLNIVAGFLEYRYNLGSGSANIRSLKVISPTVENSAH